MGFFPLENNFKKPEGLEKGSKVITDFNKHTVGKIYEVTRLEGPDTWSSSGWKVTIRSGRSVIRDLCASWCKVVE